MYKKIPLIGLVLATMLAAQTTQPTTQPVMQYQQYAYSTTIRKPSIKFTQASGWHSGGDPIILSVDSIRSISPSVTVADIPVLDATGKPVIDLVTKKPKVTRKYSYQTRIELEPNGVYFVSEEFHDVGRMLRKAGWGSVVPLTRYIHQMDIDVR